MNRFSKNSCSENFQILKKKSKWELFFNKIAAKLPISFKCPEFFV